MPKTITLSSRIIRRDIFRAMFSQFERQYSDFLRNHLTLLSVKDNRTSEENILSHINTHLQSCSSEKTFIPTLAKSFKSDELARAHVAFAEELIEGKSFVLALSELCEAIKNSATTETLVLIVSTRIVILSKLDLAHELKADLRLLKSICCKSCFKTIFTPNLESDQNSDVAYESKACQFSIITSKFGPIERCSLTKPKKNQLQEIHKNQFQGQSTTKSRTTPHNPPRGCSPPDLVTPTVLSDEYNFVTSKLRIDQSGEKGRHVVAAEDIHIGENSYNSTSRLSSLLNYWYRVQTGLFSSFQNNFLFLLHTYTCLLIENSF